MWKNPLVVGYKGEIGSFILQGLLKTMPKALNILCFDIGESEAERIDRIKKSDFIFLCVPIEDTIKWIKKYKRYLEDKVIIEQTSLKSKLYSVKEFSKLKIIGMHLLFRPSGTPNLEDRRCILLDNTTRSVLGTGEHLFSGMIEALTGSKIIWCEDAEHHDLQMSVQMALVHRTLLVLDRMIQWNPSKTYVGGKVVELAERIRKGNPTLYSKIQGNKKLKCTLRQFKNKLSDFKLLDYM